ncbi:hypothetical protein Dsin_022046 [Dipteronia sinensis]|uniref:Disease resistance protein RPM1-like n=1 Tax=Dipteronia sinensis TaxID=43782 RepID=A0AAE0A238_9ROSI|nr:hypothetical protein Dsin_022046 [Dipteronia sinensis]
MADIAVSAALVLVEEVFLFLEREANLKKDVRDDFQKIRGWLSTVQACLQHMDGKEGDEIMQKDRVRQVRDLAYEIEDVLDEFKIHVPQKFHRHRLSKYAESVVYHFKHWGALHDMSSEVQRINGRMNNIIDMDRLRNIISSEEGSSSGARVELYHVTPKEDDMVGFEGHIEALIHHLVGGSRSRSRSRRKTIWVVGPGGSGKTILVKNVYESKKILKQYDCHAWIHVSRGCKINEVLLSMLKQLCKGREESNLPTEDIRAKVRNHLQRRRYLIVLDDVWSKDVWECIVNALPQGSGGSGIIVTSRNLNVALSCVESSDYIHELKGLEWEEAWHLFCKKTFQNNEGCCPKELLEWSENIVTKCERLPLAIAAVGSLLSKKRQTPNEWKKLHDSLGSDYNLAIISRILLPSYKDLPNNLKNCFLYFSIFPEDYSIERGRLIRLWIAEGFIKERRGKTLEDVAEDYLSELIGRNLVEVSKWDFDGRVSSCRVQNLIREFIISKSKEENFVEVLAKSNLGIPADYKIRRLSIHHSNTRWSDMSGLSCVRSFFIFEFDNSFHSRIRKLLHDFRLVRSLDLQGAPLAEFHKEIVELTLLRYLSLRGTKIAVVPKSIKKLAYLETLNLKHTCVTKLPFEIYGLKFLQHLLVYHYNVKKYVIFDSAQGVEVPAGVQGLSAILKLSLIQVNKHQKIIAELKFLVELRKLGLTGLKREDGRELCASIQKMKKLSTLDVCSSYKEEYLELDDMDNPPILLQRLYLKGHLHKFPAWVSSLDSLVRIGLKWSRLETSPLEALQAFPNLVELEMVDAYTGNALEFKVDTFKELKFLHLEQIDRLNMMIVEEKAMPKLRKLTICKCEKMEMLPLGISNLTQLQELLVYDMHMNFVDRLQKNSEDRCMIDHIPVIHSFTLGINQYWSLQKFLDPFHHKESVFSGKKNPVNIQSLDFVSAFHLYSELSSVFV